MTLSAMKPPAMPVHELKELKEVDRWTGGLHVIKWCYRAVIETSTGRWLLQAKSMYEPDSDFVTVEHGHHVAVRMLDILRGESKERTAKTA